MDNDYQGTITEKSESNFTVELNNAADLTLSSLSANDVISGLLDYYKGDRGETGEKGEKGEKGDKGYSAFEEWQLKEGNQGKTYDDFLNSISPSIDYVRGEAVPTTVGNIKAGSTFSGTVQDALDMLLYPKDGNTGGGNDDETENGHTHSNYDVLETITSSKVSEWDNKFDGDYNDLTNKPKIPTKLSDLEIDIELNGNDPVVTENTFVTPEQFGAKGDGVTNDTNAIKQCVQYCQNNNTTMVLTKEYLIDSTISITKKMKIVSYGGGFNLGGLQWQYPIIEIKGSLSTNYSLSDTVSVGSSTLPITGVSALSWLLLKSNKSCLSQDYPHYSLGVTTGSTDKAYYGEFVQVSSGSQLFGNVVFPSYGTDTTATKVNFVDEVVIEGLNFHNGSVTSSNHYILVQYGKDCKIMNCSCEDAVIGNFITFSNCLSCVGKDNVLKYKTKSYTNYYERNGFKMLSSQWCVFDNCTSYNGTQPFDITYTGGNILSSFCKIVNCKAINSMYTSFTTHPATYRCSIMNCVGNSNGDGISVRGRGHLICDNILQGTSTSDYGICLAEGCGFETTVSNNNIKGFGEGIRINETYSSSRNCSYTLPLNSVFTGNVVSTFNIGIRIDRATSTTKTDATLGISFVGNVFKDFVGDNKYLMYVTGNGNLTTRGISFQDNLIDCVNSGMYNSSVVQSLVRLETNITNFSFTGNAFLNIPSSAYIIYGTTSGRTVKAILNNNGLDNPLSTNDGVTSITVQTTKY